MRTESSGYWAEPWREAPQPEYSPNRTWVLVEDRGEVRGADHQPPGEAECDEFLMRANVPLGARRDRDKKAVVLTGIGPSFCAGWTLVEARKHTTPSPAGPVRRCRAGPSARWICGLTRRSSSPRSTDLGAGGGGSTLINNCELAVAAESATIGTPEIGFGAWPTRRARR